MKARIKATGYVAEVSLSHIVYDGGKKIMWYNTLQGASFTGNELEFIDTEENFDYWTHLEHTYAGMAMQGMIRTVGHNIMYKPEKIAIYAEACAHALVEKMKNQNV